MAQTITISNITKVSDSTYSVEFSANFTLSELFYQTSINGNTWTEAVELTNLSSPAIITVPNHINFMVRLYSDYTPPPPVETGFLMINNNDKLLINDTDSLKYIN